MDKAISRDFRTTHFYFLHRAYDFLFFCGEIMTQRQATAAAAAVPRACYNQLATTLERYRAQQQQATPCACDRSTRYCVELLWKAPEIHHPSHLLVPGISAVVVAVLLRSAQNPDTCNSTQLWRQRKEHATASIPVVPSSRRQRHARVADARCTLSSRCRT